MPLQLLEEIRVGLLGLHVLSCLAEWSVGWCQGRGPGLGSCPSTELPSSFCKAKKWFLHTLCSGRLCDWCIGTVRSHSGDGLSGPSSDQRMVWDDGVGLVEKGWRKQPEASSFGPRGFQHSRMLSFLCRDWSPPSKLFPPRAPVVVVVGTLSHIFAGCWHQTAEGSLGLPWPGGTRGRVKQVHL